jgi:hypothetical protein
MLKPEYQLWIKERGEDWRMVGFFPSAVDAREVIQLTYNGSTVMETRIVAVDTRRMT